MSNSSKTNSNLCGRKIAPFARFPVSGAAASCANVARFHSASAESTAAAPIYGRFAIQNAGPPRLTKTS